MKQEVLNEILEFHKMWLNSEKGGKRANLKYADLRGSDLRRANLKYVDLIGSALRGSDLRGADLRGSDLRGADLRRAYLRNTDLRDVDLRDADLRDVDLRDVDLRDVDLRDVDLRDCIGNNKEIKSLQIGTYLISYTKNILNIGCKSHTLDEWKVFTDDEISKMDEYALEWWKLNKDIVIELVEREIKG